MPSQSRPGSITETLRNEPAWAGLARGFPCIVGIGNRLKADDAAGPLVIDRLRNRTGAALVDAGVAPENYLEKIAQRRPDTVVLVDAVDFGGQPGAVRIFRENDLVGTAVSTHASSLGLVAGYLKARGAGRVILIGIQPGTVGLGRALTPGVSSAVTTLAEELIRLCPPTDR